jgi:MFS transporter, ACS family, tartrate transporter
MPVSTPVADVARVPVLTSALRKARWRLIPLLSVCYLVAYMDRINISFAAESMNRDLHFTPKIYGLGAGLFFLTYALCEIPSNRLLLRFGARRWMARIMLTWGLLAAVMILVKTPRGFYGLRMLLGMAEAGYFPGALFYLSLWFPKRERARAISLFYVALPISTVVMGGLAGSLLRLNGRLGLMGWQWLFLVEALPAIALSVVVWFALPDGPSKARWLETEECDALMTELRHAPPAGHVQSNAQDLRAALKSKYVWGFGLFFFCTLGSNYAVNFSLPILLKEATGWSPGRVGGLIAVVGLMGAASMIGNAVHSDRRGERMWHIVVPTLAMAFGLLAAGLHMGGWFAVGALAFAAVTNYAIQGPMLSVCSMVLPGDAAAVGIATINMCAIAGGFVGPYWMGWMREATGTYAVGIGGLFVPCLLAGLSILWLLPRWNAAMRRLELPAGE